MVDFDFEKVDVEKIQETLTFGETDAVELMTGLGLGELQTKRLAMLNRAMVVIGLRRQGHNVSLKDLENDNPADFIVMNETPEEQEENPTDASDY